MSGAEVPEVAAVLAEAETRIERARGEQWQQHLRDHPHGDGKSCPRCYGLHDAFAIAAGIVREMRREADRHLVRPHRLAAALTPGAEVSDG